LANSCKTTVMSVVVVSWLCGGGQTGIYQWKSRSIFVF
jgi:hypothetical protein